MTAGPATSDPLVSVLHEDGDLLVVNKPAGLVCHPTKGDAFSSLISRARLHAGGSASVHLINRLDRETSGVILLAKNSFVAGEMGKLLVDRATRKEYLAIVQGQVAVEAGVIEEPLGRDDSSDVAIKDRVRADGAAARTEFFRLRCFERDGRAFTLLRVEPHTGRKHQIRIHLAHIGHPIVGDKIYGGDEQLYLEFIRGRLTPEQRGQLILPHHALHAGRLAFHWRGRDWEFAASPEEWFRAFAGL
jgi:23S rRNA pseudouridine1911/1915/1917 synthase